MSNRSFLFVSFYALFRHGISKIKDIRLSQWRDDVIDENKKEKFDKMKQKQILHVL